MGLDILVPSSDCKITSLLLYGVLTLVVSYLSYLFLKWQRKVWLINRIPGPKAIPILGNALELNVDSNEFFKLYFYKYCQYGPGLYRVWIGPTPFCVIHNADGAETILRNQKYIDKSREYSMFHPWLRTGLLTSTGNKWHSRRKMLTPSFHFKILEDFVDIFNQQSLKFVSKLEAKMNGDSFDIFPLISLCTLDIIIETAMGTSINAQDDSESDYVKAVIEASSYILMRFRMPWLRPDICFRLSGYAKKNDRCMKVLHGLSTKSITERKREYLRLKSLEDKKGDKEEMEILGKRKRLAFLDLLIEHSEEGNVLSDEDIREEVDTFMFEGQDTTAAAINWSIYLLGSHPEIQDKVFEELDMIFGDSERPATSEDLREMKYLECCIKEALRIFPSVPFIGRIIEEDVEVNGFTIPKGTGINILIYSIHRDPIYYPNPEEFQPERFFPENSVKRHPYAYIPFSAGPRNCIGQKFAQMEEKIVLSYFFRKYRVESSQKREDLKLIPDLILRPEDGTLVQIFPRKR